MTIILCGCTHCTIDVSILLFPVVIVVGRSAVIFFKFELLYYYQHGCATCFSIDILYQFNYYLYNLTIKFPFKIIKKVKFWKWLKFCVLRLICYIIIKHFRIKFKYQIIQLYDEIILLHTRICMYEKKKYFRLLYKKTIRVP